MVPEEVVSGLSELLLEAKTRARGARAEGRDPRPIESVGRSLRRTLASVVPGRDLRETASREFSLLATRSGEVSVKHGERMLPVSGAYLASLLAEAGVKVVPGQVLLLDPLLVLLLVEEALGALRLGQAEIRDARSRLIRASLEADAMLRGSAPEEDPFSSGVA